jgi:hypothetical protein
MFQRFQSLRRFHKFLLSAVVCALVFGAVFAVTALNKSASQSATAQTAEVAKCNVSVQGYTVSSTGSTAACNFTLDLSQSGLQQDLESIKQMLAMLPGQKSVNEIKDILETIGAKVADKQDVTKIVDKLDDLSDRGYEARFGFGSKLGTAVFATSLTKQVGKVNFKATGYASLPSDANLPKLCGEVGAGQDVTLGLGACLDKELIQRYITLGYQLKPFNGFTPTVGLEFSDKGISASLVVNGQGIR